MAFRGDFLAGISGGVCYLEHVEMPEKTGDDLGSDLSVSRLVLWVEVKLSQIFTAAGWRRVAW